MIHFVQPRSLNHYVDDSIPLTLQWRWQALRMSIPLILFCCVIYAPIQLAMMWLEQSWDRLNFLLRPFLLFPTFFLLLSEILIRVQQQSRRSLKIADDRLIFPFDRHFSWAKFAQVNAFHFEPIPNAPELRIVSINIKSARNNKTRIWRMVLPLVEINSVLLPELDRRKRDHHHAFSITFAHEPARNQPRPRLPQPWFIALGMALLVYSLPLFLVFSTADRSRPQKQNASEHRSEKFKLTAEAKERLRTHLLRHFESYDQLRTFLLFASGTGTFFSIGLIFYDLRRLKRAGSKTENPDVGFVQEPSSLPL